MKRNNLISICWIRSVCVHKCVCRCEWFVCVCMSRDQPCCKWPILSELRLSLEAWIRTCKAGLVQVLIGFVKHSRRCHWLRWSPQPSPHTGVGTSGSPCVSHICFQWLQSIRAQSGDYISMALCSIGWSVSPMIFSRGGSWHILHPIYFQWKSDDRPRKAVWDTWQGEQVA